MKKLLKYLLFVSMLALCILTAVSCGKRLDTPKDFTLNETTLVLTWDRVNNAQSYLVEISGQPQPISLKKAEFSLADLDEGTYIIKVKAVGDNMDHTDSAYATYEFTRAKETGLRYQLINNQSEYQLVGAGSATGDVVMESTYRGKPVTAIAEKALYNNTTITSFTVSDTVKSIGEKAFSRCASLTKVVISDSVKSLGENLFLSSKALTSVKLPANLTEIPNYTFSWCPALSELTLGTKITKIGEYAFANCKALTEISLPSSLHTIATYAFSDCSALTTVSLPGVKTIDSLAFSNCSALSNITFGDQLLTIGDRAFRGCKSLTELVIPDSVTYLGAESFCDCIALEDISIGEGVTEIGSNAFLATKVYNDAEDLVIVDGWVIANKDPEITSLTLPAGVFGIAGYAFAKCDQLEQVTLSGIKYIGNSAFHKCDMLWAVVADNALLSIGDYAFSNCAQLDTVQVGNSLQTIGKYSFAGCSILETMALPDTLTSIGTYAFKDTQAYKNAANIQEGAQDEYVVYIDDWVVDMNYTSGMMYDKNIILRHGVRGIADYAFANKSISKGISIPNTVLYVGRSAFYMSAANQIVLSTELVRIGDYAFYGCQTALFGNNGVTVIPSKVTYIGRSAFYGCAKIASLTIPASVKTVGDYAFYGCVNLGIVDTETDPENPFYGVLEIEEGVESFGVRVFQYCTALKEVTIPNSVTSLGSHAFYKCAALETVTIGTGVKSILPYTFYKCEALTTANLSSSVTEIGNYAFRGCTLLGTVALDSVKTIGNNAFYKCESLTVTLPDTLVSIGNYAFRGCTAITSLVIPASVTEIGKHAFYGMNETTFYTEATKRPADWNFRFNSSYRPIFFGCTVEDGYVVSVTITDTTLQNPNAKGGIADPVRADHTFLGYATEAGSQSVAYTSETVKDAPVGTTLYTIFVEETN